MSTQPTTDLGSNTEPKTEVIEVIHMETALRFAPNQSYEEDAKTALWINNDGVLQPASWIC